MQIFSNIEIPVKLETVCLPLLAAIKCHNVALVLLNNNTKPKYKTLVQRRVYKLFKGFTLTKT